MTKPPVYTCFYTAGTLYEKEADRLRGSLERQGLPHDLRAIPVIGDWVANSRYTARHILTMIDAYPGRHIVQLDADAYLWDFPSLFHDGINCDIAACRMPWGQLANGTIYIAPTQAARGVIQKYVELIDQNANCTDEQKMLDVAMKHFDGRFKFVNLPLRYCWIEDLHRQHEPNATPLIEHLQASRERSPGEALQNRKKRIEAANRDLYPAETSLPDPKKKSKVTA